MVPRRAALRIGLEALVVTAAFLLALMLRFAGNPPSWLWPRFIAFVVPVALVYASIGLIPERRTLRHRLRIAATVALSIGVPLLWSEMAFSLPIPPTVLVLGVIFSALGLVIVRLADRRLR